VQSKTIRISISCQTRTQSAARGVFSGPQSRHTIDLRCRPPPHYAEHTRAILAELGYSDDAIERMIEAEAAVDGPAAGEGQLTRSRWEPFSLEQTVASGIVGALVRTGSGSAGYERCIRSRASINPGNPGGALADSLYRMH